MEPIEFIREIHPFDLLEASVVDLITDSLEVVHLPTGTWVIDRAGSAHRSLDIVREGAVRLERDGRPLMLVEEGEFYGHAELITGATPAEAVAESESVVYRLPEVVFRRLMEHSEFAHFFRLAGELALARLDPMGDSSFARSFRDLSDTIRRSQPGESPLRFAVDLALPAYRLLTRPPLRVGAQATVAEAARAMRDARASSVLVNDDPPGIVTDRDLRNRVLAQGMGADTPVAEVMSRPLRTLPAATPIFEALTFMVDEDIHHLPLEEGGEIVGVITDTVFLRHQARSPFAVLRRFERTHDRAVLARFPEELAGVAEAYLRGGVEPTGVGRVIGVWGDTLVRSIIRSTHATLGPPPAPYAWLGLGSLGRREQGLNSDQDTGLVYLAESTEAQEYFPAMAEQVTAGLETAGMPRCRGGYMATGWCHPLERWVELFRRWIDLPEPEALLEASIFFDFRRVAGDLDLNPLEEVMAIAADRPRFLAHLAAVGLELRPPLGLFSRIVADDEGIDLKQQGLAPIVALARHFALQVGSRERSTVARLQAAGQAGALPPEGSEALAEAFRYLGRLRLERQVRDVAAGDPPGNRVALDRLSSIQRRHLKEAFVAVRHVQEAVAERYTTDRLG